MKIIRGLKEALKIGTDTSVTKLHRTNGYLTDQYRKLVSKYNLAVTAANLTGKNYPKVTTNSLSEYTTQRALEGLFLKVAEARVADILKKVFGKND